MIAIDGHVHIHDCFEIEQFLQNAVKNLKHHAEQEKHSPLRSFALFLTETKTANCFKTLAQKAASADSTIGNNIILRQTDEENSIYAEFTTGEKLFLIAGRQIVTKEDLEVLPIGICEHFGEKEPIEEVIRVSLKKGAIPLIPWGFGKWLGGRGQVVETLFSKFSPEQIYFGDNGNRFKISGSPKLLAQSENAGFLSLSGSDPLPLPSEANKVGQLGFIIDAEINVSKPFKSIKSSIQKLNKSPQTIGKLENSAAFLKNQFYMQYYKRIKK